MLLDVVVVPVVVVVGLPKVVLLLLVKGGGGGNEPVDGVSVPVLGGGGGAKVPPVGVVDEELTAWKTQVPLLGFVCVTVASPLKLQDPEAAFCFT